MLNIDKQKYIELARSKGLAAAITQLHLDYGYLEYNSFEGEKGYQPEMWEDLKNLRAFSRELWNAVESEQNPLSGTVYK